MELKGLPLLIFCYSVLCFLSNISIAVDTMALNQTITGDQTLVSAGQTFELGFFTPGNSRNCYLGIWYKNIPLPTIVWVANRDNPLTDSSGALKIGDNGNLVLLNKTGSIVWSSISSRAAKIPIAQLLDSGNLVLRDESGDDSESYLWQSFDYPSDTLMPGMKFGLNFKTGHSWYLTSWKAVEDPSTGDFTYKLDIRGLPQLLVRKGGESGDVQYRSGPWDGVRFGGGFMRKNSVFNPIFVFDAEEVYYAFENNDKSAITRFVVNQSGSLQYLTWNDRRQEWVDIIMLQKDNCDNYGLCGGFGICNINDSPVCECLKGFTPKVPQDYNALDWSDGCVPKSPSSDCKMGEGFYKFQGLKLPDASQILGNMSMSSEDCEMVCLNNCSCKAYSITENSGCVVWSDVLIDIRQYVEGGHDLYVRLAASELDSNNKKQVVIVISLSAISTVLVIGSIGWCVIWNRKRALRRDRDLHIQENPEEDLELPLFDLDTIRDATKNFSFTKIIGKGGFGPVYKGELPTGQEIAVKRLSQDSGQGLNEFKNEVTLIANLQHRNLVRLLGCCIEGQERMLIYEYMPNKSLNTFIFGQTKSTSLDWAKRFDIIVGIARGLLYLHRDSRLRIIHRDLKASNILLDIEMNPKISDFGLARIFGGDQIQENTKRVMGTYGYMPPEYAIDGLFSVKSDVFSFGVIVLEIISGKKNRGFYHPDHDLNLLGHTWILWNEDRALELVDPLMERPFSLPEMLRCIQVGLLCVQQRPEDRPTMSSVVLMLDSETTILAQPRQPGFYTERFPTENDLSSTGKKNFTSNEVTITLIDGR
ncbi:PREDICTED: G-type lectin S-receptor-like serine/threonine-protein kinase At4g27290 [Nelumbo nucifera]|uniref:Receptor-like serine/threonine-protein kinase n=2 Tax=Nelumbo nucifera TaxID=4432 RepID=A0A1U7Z5Y2_NELNU|nr:PREDICTED: G-type lectin S-receptor-like serine/threonine-protein kinase At4g27290 [Nelumbo nucifera]DAD23156.1 TPA_asm: hypothetical protein HUJ06_024619 [Nelumbo nucifera]